MVRPATLTARPALLLFTIGGAVATLLLSALLFLAPVFGFPFVDFPLLVGGIFTDTPEAAFWLGFWLFFLVGWFVFPALLFMVWPAMPGRNTGFLGALVKGLLFGAALWVLSGLLLPLFALLNQLTGQGLESPGFFALEAGILGALGVLLGHLAYGLALALVAAMGQGISPMDTIGWAGYEKADTAVGPPPPNVATHGA